MTLQVIDVPVKKRGVQKVSKVSETLNKLHVLQEELNKYLVTNVTDRPLVQSPQAVYDLMSPFLSYIPHEEMWIMMLDTRMRVIGITKLYQGTLDSSPVRVGELFRQAIAQNANNIILLHNHPSGDTTPSPEDINVTRECVAAGKILDIPVSDHLIIGENKFTSLKEKGLGF